jgi:hypothetical protein
MRHLIRGMFMREPREKKLLQVQIMLSEMLNASAAQEDTMAPDNRRLGCHMALLSALLKANVMGPLTVRRQPFCHSSTSHGDNARELHLPLLVHLDQSAVLGQHAAANCLLWPCMQERQQATWTMNQAQAFRPWWERVHLSTIAKKCTKQLASPLQSCLQ